jgi:putative ABC transport system ATP-binding protein
LLDTPTSGEYFFLGEDVSRLSERRCAQHRKGRVGFVFQNFNLIDELKVTENVELPLLYSGVARAERERRSREALQKVGMDHRFSHFPAQLSGGQQQRVAVARAIVADPVLILADEPTGNLDSVHGEQVMDLLKKLNGEGTTIVMVTHSEEYAGYGNRVVHLKDGQLVTNGDGAPAA